MLVYTVEVGGLTWLRGEVDMKEGERYHVVVEECVVKEGIMNV